MLHGMSLKRENGWLFTTKTGLYGTNYLQRAFITAIGLGAKRPQDAVYPMSQRASLLEAYEGDKKYTLRFEKGQLLPVKGSGRSPYMTLRCSSSPTRSIATR
jgi:hypothetical protein